MEDEHAAVVEDRRAERLQPAACERVVDAHELRHAARARREQDGAPVREAERVDVAGEKGDVARVVHRRRAVPDVEGAAAHLLARARDRGELPAAQREEAGGRRAARGAARLTLVRRRREERDERDLAAGVHHRVADELLQLAGTRLVPVPRGRRLPDARHLRTRDGRRQVRGHDGLARGSAADLAAERDPAVARGGRPADEARAREHAAAGGGVADRGHLGLGGRPRSLARRREQGRAEQGERGRQARREPMPKRHLGERPPRPNEQWWCHGAPRRGTRRPAADRAPVHD